MTQTSTMKPRLNPARRVVELLGGEAKAAEIAGVVPKNVYRWQWPAGQGGTGGVIPMERAMRLLRWSREHGGPLKPEHFFS